MTEQGALDRSDPVGDLRAFVAVRLGGYSWVVDLLQDYLLTVGSGPEADIRIEVPNVSAQQVTLLWNGEQVILNELGGEAGVEINGEPAVGTNRVSPGDEIKVGPASLIVNITLAPQARGRRSLTHQEFIERLSEELARAERAGRHTCLMMLKSKSGDGSRLANGALSSFRGGDIVGTYAHDEIEFLLPDTPPSIAKVVVERLIERAGADGAHVGLAVAPADGTTAERLVRAGRDALAAALESDQTIARTGASETPPASEEAHTDATKQVVAEIVKNAQEGASILLLGEPNSGKRHYARLFHERSNRKDGPFVTINCASLVDPEAIDRAFGGSEGVEHCLAETAQGGTLLLEEVGDLPLQGQRRLLRLFEEGSEDYNIVSTTHRDISGLCTVGAFLRELHDKIATNKLAIPALRMRAESIVPLAKDFAQQYKSDRPVRLSEGAIQKMRSYTWPGNVLELRNAMERAVALADGGEILAEHLPGDATDTGEGRLREHVGSIERDAIIKALADNNYNQTHAAKLLGISRRALIYKMEKYGLKPPPGGVRKRQETEQL